MPSSFYIKEPAATLQKIIQHIGLDIEVIGEQNIIIDDISVLAKATSKDIVFYHNVKYLKDLQSTKAMACIVTKENMCHVPKKVVAVVTKNPQLVYGAMIDYFYKERSKDVKISSAAIIHPTARVGHNCLIEAGVQIAAKVVLGDGVVVCSNTVIEEGVTVGSGTRIGNNASISFCRIGASCHLLPGVRVGQDGFGFIPGKGNIKHVGMVIIGDNVSIGANSCIDRGVIDDTVIGHNCKIDNLVQIGHNVKLGANVLIAALVGIAGSAKIGDNVMIGGQSGVANHIKIGKNAKLAGRSGVVQDVLENSVVGGFPAVKIKSWHRQNILLKKQTIKSNE